MALRRGPLIYCFEEADNPGGELQTLSLPRSSPIGSDWRGDLFGGVVTLKAEGRRDVSEGALYAPTPPEAREAPLTAIPYYLWANRDPGSMQVWIAETPAPAK